MPAPLPKRPHTLRTIVLTVLGTIVGLLILIVVSVWMLAKSEESESFGSARPSSDDRAYRTSGIPSMMEAAPEPSMSPPPRGDVGRGATADDRERLGPKIIRTGRLTLRVDDTERRLEEAKKLAVQFGGFVADVTLEDDEGVRTADVVIRVPSDQFDALVTSAKKLAVIVLSEATNAEDVTDVFVDLEARLKAAGAEETQYLDILKKAKSVEETLQVTEALGEVRTRIEQMEGRLRLMRDRTDYATLRLVLTEETRVEVASRTWAPLETLRQAFQGLVYALQGTIDLLIVLVIFGVGLVLPTVILVIVAYRLIRKLIKKLRG